MLHHHGEYCSCAFAAISEVLSSVTKACLCSLIIIYLTRVSPKYHWLFHAKYVRIRLLVMTCDVLSNEERANETASFTICNEHELSPTKRLP